jgi:lipid-A-disaccharide synthase
VPDLTPPRVTRDPPAAVRRELVRALAGVVSTPFRVLGFVVRRGHLRRELAGDLNHPASISSPPPFHPTGRQPRVFLSCAEPSGELHALNFLRELRALTPGAVVEGLGSSRLAAEHMTILDDPVQRATMGFRGVAGALPYYIGLLEQCAGYFRSEAPDVAVLIDSPALHVPLGRIARQYGVPVLHFVTPQHWAWAPWRAASYARAVTRALTILPFEPSWFERRGVPVAHVGHPLLDELARVPAARAPDSSSTIAVLPGSRASVIDLNLPWMLSVLAALRQRMPGTDVVILQAGDRHRARIDARIAEAGAGSWTRVETGDLHGSLARARVAISVSGTVLLDVLHHRLPTVCIYRVGSWPGVLMYRHALLTPWFASVNLLAGREIVPEFCFQGRGPFDEVVAALQRLFLDGDARREAIKGLELAAERLGPPGACRRAALHALDLARGRLAEGGPEDPPLRTQTDGNR